MNSCARRRPVRIHYMGRHRNSQKRIYIPGATYFITTVTHGRYPYFEEEIFRELLVDELLFCSELKSFSLYAYAVMPDHAHVLIRPMGGFTYSQIMHFIKRHCARNANFIMGMRVPTMTMNARFIPANAPPKARLANRAFGGAFAGMNRAFIVIVGTRIPIIKFAFRAQCRLIKCIICEYVNPPIGRINTCAWSGMTAYAYRENDFNSEQNRSSSTKSSRNISSSKYGYRPCVTVVMK